MTYTVCTMRQTTPWHIGIKASLLGDGANGRTILEQFDFRQRLPSGNRVLQMEIQNIKHIKIWLNKYDTHRELRHFSKSAYEPSIAEITYIIKSGVSGQWEIIKTKPIEPMENGRAIRERANRAKGHPSFPRRREGKSFTRTRDRKKR